MANIKMALVMATGDRIGNDPFVKSDAG